jgi:hypothetical protein
VLATYQGVRAGEDPQNTARSSSTETDVLDRNSDDWPTGSPARVSAGAIHESVNEAIHADAIHEDEALDLLEEPRQVATVVAPEELPKVSVRARIQSMNSGQVETRRDIEQHIEPSGKSRKKDRQRRRKEDAIEAAPSENRDSTRRRSKGSKAWKLSLGIVSGLMRVKAADISMVVAYAGEYCSDIPKRRRIRLHRESGDWRLEKSAVTVHDDECKLFVITADSEVLAESPILTGMDLRNESDVSLAAEGQRVGTITLLAHKTRSSGNKESSTAD